MAATTCLYVLYPTRHPLDISCLGLYEQQSGQWQCVCTDMQCWLLPLERIGKCGVSSQRIFLGGALRGMRTRASAKRGGIRGLRTLRSWGVPEQLWTSCVQSLPSKWLLRTLKRQSSFDDYVLSNVLDNR